VVVRTGAEREQSSERHADLEQAFQRHLRRAAAFESRDHALRHARPFRERRLGQPELASTAPHIAAQDAERRGRSLLGADPNLELVGHRSRPGAHLPARREILIHEGN
jgi:hypothetical protein